MSFHYVEPCTQRLHRSELAVPGSSTSVTSPVPRSSRDSTAVRGTPDRLAYDADRNQVAVVHGYERTAVLSLLDLGTGDVTEVELPAYGIHATYADDGKLWVLTRPSAKGYAVVVDPDEGVVEGSYALGNSGWTYEIGVTADAVITGSVVHERTPVEDTLPVRYRTEGSFAFNPRLAAVSKDGSDMLYASRLTSAIDAHDIATGDRGTEYYLGEGGGGPRDYGYSHDGSSVYVLTTDFKQHYFRIFDADSGELTGQVNSVMPDHFDTVIFDEQFYVLSADGQRAWVVLSREQRSVLSWVPITLAEGS